MPPARTCASNTAMCFRSTIPSVEAGAAHGVGAQGGAGGETWYPAYPDGQPGATGALGSVVGELISAVEGPVTLLNTIVASATSSALCFGRIIDAGYNLCSDATCLFTNVTSLNNVDPLLTPLNDFGGPTKTMALRPGSPAANAGSPTSFSLHDQRGVPRPQATRPDIGAFELPVLLLSRESPNNIRISFYALKNQPYAIEASPDLISWSRIESGHAADTAWLSFSIPSSSPSAQFFRYVSP